MPATLVRIAAIALLALGASATASASTLDLSAGLWKPSIDGRSADAQGSVDFAALGVDGDTRPDLALGWQQDDGSWWPDVALAYAGLGGQGHATASEPIGIGGIDVAPGREAGADASVDEFTLGLRYPVLNLGPRLDLGLSLRRLDGDIRYTNDSSGARSVQRIDETFPLLDAALGWPVGRWRLLAHYRWAGRDGESAREAGAGVALTLWQGLQLQAGWQYRHYAVESADYRLNARLEGLRLGLGWTFASP